MAIDYGITGKRALVCAASGGLGLASAEALALCGVDLLLCARSKDKLAKQAERLIRTYGVRVDYHTCDLTLPADRTTLINAVLALWAEGPDIIIHNGGGPAPSTVMTTPFEAWQAGFDLLFLPATHLNRALVPLMQQKTWGRIVHITSGAVPEPNPNLPVSNAMRSAVTAYNKTLAQELATFGITVNCVAPGFIATNRMEQLIAHQAQATQMTTQDIEDKLFNNIPAKRLGEPKEFGAAVAFLCSNGASYITGETLMVDGGKRQSLI
jgi:3-oxoacyl-[acyl-carrier protein] reductase